MHVIKPPMTSIKLQRVSVPWCHPQGVCSNKGIHVQHANLEPYRPNWNDTTPRDTIHAPSSMYSWFIFSCGAATQRWPWLHTQRHSTVGRIPPDEWSARRRDLYLQHADLTTDKHRCIRRNSIPQSQQASGRKPTPYTVRPLGPVLWYVLSITQDKFSFFFFKLYLYILGYL